MAARVRSSILSVMSHQHAESGQRDHDHAPGLDHTHEGAHEQRGHGHVHSTVTKAMAAQAKRAVRANRECQKAEAR